MKSLMYLRTSTPTNFWYNNVGTNSDSFGFWFELHGHPNNFLADGDFSVCPNHEPLGEFRNNTFRANGAIGFRIYPEYTPLVDPCNSYSASAPQDLYDTVSYHNPTGMFSKHHGDLHHHGYTLVENGVDVSIRNYEYVSYTTNPALYDFIFVGSLNKDFNILSNSGQRAAIFPQNEYFFIRKAKVINYGATGAFSGCNSCDVGESFVQGGYTTRFQEIEFINTTRRIYWLQHFKEIFHDLDGSLTNEVNGMISFYYAYNLWNHTCYHANELIFDHSIICKNTTKIRRLAVNGFSPYKLAYYPLSINSSAGSANIPFLPRDIYGWVFPIVVGHQYSMDWSVPLESATDFQFIFSRGPYLQETYKNNFIESLEMNYTSYFSDYHAYEYAMNLLGTYKYYSSLNTSVSLNSSLGATFYNQSTRELNMILSNKGAQFSWGDYAAYVSASARLCPPHGCPVPPKPVLGKNYTMWSSPTTWTKHPGGVPIDGIDVTIEGSEWIVLDVTSPRLRKLTIFGKLSFLSQATRPLNLIAESIIVYGVLEINGEIVPHQNITTTPEFIGSAVITLHGDRTTSIPPVLGEGLFIGSKVIAVAGEFNAVGSVNVTSSVKLSSTALKAGNTVQVVASTPLHWSSGDSIVLSSTAYFDEAGDVTYSNSTEIVSIVSVSYSGNIATIKLSSPLKFTHACIDRLGENFCGFVGHLTRNIKVVSEDISGPYNWGFGGSIAVVDISSASDDEYNYYVGTLNLIGVEFQNIGKSNDVFYGISINYRDYHDTSNIIENCTFTNLFNFALYSTFSTNVTFNNNVVAGTYGGGVYVDEKCTGIVISNNIIMDVKQYPQIFENGYAWVVPLAVYTFNSYNGLYFNNIAAGSYDTGFYVGTSVFSGYNGLLKSPYLQPLGHLIKDANPCGQTRGELGAGIVDVSAILLSSIFKNNEAVACRVGLMVVNNDFSESNSDTCAVVSGIKVWRNAHVGVLGVDAIANTFVTNIVAAENHIAISFSYYRSGSNGYSGVSNSKIIGTLSNTACDESIGTSWFTQKCQAFSANDPYGLSSSCQSVLGSSIYTRVGILIPQSLNGPKTCRLAATFPDGTCFPSIVPDRTCGMPWEKRYGLPVGDLYVEAHIHNNIFSGFTNSSCKNIGAAVGINPSQIDIQPVIVSSQLHWEGEKTGLMDIGARLGMYVSSEYQCGNSDCAGHHMLIIHDDRGFLLNTVDSLLPDVNSRNAVHGQIYFDNPEYAGSNLVCTEAPILGYQFTSCIYSSDNSIPQFKGYTGNWVDVVDAGDSLSTGPINIYRYAPYDGSNAVRSFSGFGPHKDPCPDIMPTNRFPLIFTAGYYHHLILVGETPTTWSIRWNSPNANDSAVLDIFITQSYAINVFVGSNDNDMVHIPTGVKLPQLSDKAGTNMRNPQALNLTVTIRGGQNNLYMFYILPVIQVTISVTMTTSFFFGPTFAANLALLLNISPQRIKIAQVHSSTTSRRYLAASNTSKVDIEILPSNSSTAGKTNVAQFQELRNLAAKMNSTQNSTSGFINDLSKQLNASVQIHHLEVPPLPQIVQTEIVYKTLAPTQSPTFSPTSVPSLIIGPTSAPLSPSAIPSSLAPISRPTLTPSSVPSFPNPTSEPTLVIGPTSIPVYPPTSNPSISPTVAPTAFPTNKPVAKGTTDVEFSANITLNGYKSSTPVLLSLYNGRLLSNSKLVLTSNETMVIAQAVSKAMKLQLPQRVICSPFALLSGNNLNVMTEVVISTQEDITKLASLFQANLNNAISSHNLTTIIRNIASQKGLNTTFGGVSITTIPAYSSVIAISVTSNPSVTPTVIPSTNPTYSPSQNSNDDSTKSNSTIIIVVTVVVISSLFILGNIYFYFTKSKYPPTSQSIHPLDHDDEKRVVGISSDIMLDDDV